jgi:ABC-type bacteriocin/lantibiotic exporter with double-glycine peptidase domain
MVSSLFTLEDVTYRDILRIEKMEIAAGEITCILGKSGSGKTTLLKLLNHLISYDDGSIRYREQELKEIDPIELRREVIMLAQNPAIFPGNIRDNFILATIRMTLQLILVGYILGSVTLTVFLLVHLGYKTFFNDRMQLEIDR